MALKTLGTTGTTVLDAFVFGTNLSAADVALIQLAIKNDKINGNPIYPGAWSASGVLYVPNRGILQVLPGDYVGIDATGWPVLVSANAIASGSTEWAHS